VLEHYRGDRIALEPVAAEIVTFAPLRHGIAPLGLIDKLNGSAAITAWESSAAATHLRLCDGGRIGIYCERLPERIEISGRRSDVEYDASNAMLVVNAQAGMPVEIWLHH
jgi:hypothetical protein